MENEIKEINKRLDKIENVLEDLRDKFEEFSEEESGMTFDDLLDDFKYIEGQIIKFGYKKPSVYVYSKELGMREITHKQFDEHDNLLLCIEENE